MEIHINIKLILSTSKSGQDTVSVTNQAINDSQGKARSINLCANEKLNRVKIWRYTKFSPRNVRIHIVQQK